MNFNDFYGTKVATVTKANKIKRRAFVIAILVIISIIMNPAIIIMVRGQTGLKISGGLTSGSNLNSGNLYSSNTGSSQGSNGNDFPIVFIHGAGGWGEDELLGFNYWGGFHSIPDLLRALGFKVYVLQVGPVSSSWDRAVEAFYEIKGGRVNYGAAHSARFGHNQYGREFSGFYPKWGTLNPDGTIKKIHIIAHSMGGQTARVLNTLLSNIYPEEGNDTLFGESHPDWIASITTFSTTHDGTSMVMPLNGHDALTLFLQQVVGGFSAFIGANPIYDLMLDQWNLTREPGESIYHFLQRVCDSTLFNEASKDTALWDATPQGAAELNGWTPANPNTYYFSFSSCATTKLPFSDRQIPSKTMTPVFYASAILMGSLQGTDGSVTVDTDWFKNDGVVNTISMTGPKLNSSDQIVNFDRNNINPGVWNTMPELKWDHMQILGINSPWRIIKNLYIQQALLLKSLPKGEPVNIPIPNENITQTINEVNSAEPDTPPQDNVITDPSSYENNSTPDLNTLDKDNDTILDSWEVANGLSPNNPDDAYADLDNDSLSSLAEYSYKTFPTKADSDSDGLNDFIEIYNGLKPLVNDSLKDYDKDSLSNKDEILIYSTDPWNSDTDNDGYTDDYEIQHGSDPLNPSSIPPPPPLLTNSQKVIVGLIVLTPIVILAGVYKRVEMKIAKDKMVIFFRDINPRIRAKIESIRTRKELNRIKKRIEKY